MHEPEWRAGFELEVILGDLGENRFADYMDFMGPMDTATPDFCQAVAKRLTHLTSAKWSAPTRRNPAPGFYVVPEYDLDPLDWPRDRCAGVELLTPPLPLEKADAIRWEIAEAIPKIDPDFDPFPGHLSEQCAWHINIDAGPLYLDPGNLSLGCDEVPILRGNDRLFSPYTAIQRHSYGVPLLRHLEVDPGGELLGRTGLGNLLDKHAGRGKRYAANFAKQERGYVELRHFAASTFFDDETLESLLEPFTSAFSLTPSRIGPFEQALLARFAVLSRWLERNRTRIEWWARQSVVYPLGEVTFGGEQLGRLSFNGSVEMHIVDRDNREIASIREIDFPDAAEGVALLALDLAEVNRRLLSGSAKFNRAVAGLRRAIRLT